MTIVVDHIYKAFDGVSILKDITMQIADGDSIVITGMSGIGKTTFIRILLGLEKADQGSVRLLGDYKYERVNAGVVFQEDRLCEDFSAIKNVSIVNQNLTDQRAENELRELLPEECLNKPVHMLSGGMRRRVSIVRACIVPSDILVMDEPFTGLDAETRDQAIAFIRARQGNKPLVITTHDTEGLSFCREIHFG